MSEFPKQRDPVESLNELHDLIGRAAAEMRDRPENARATLREAIEATISRASLIHSPGEAVESLEAAMSLRHSNPAKSRRIINAVRAEIRRNARRRRRAT